MEEPGTGSAIWVSDLVDWALTNSHHQTVFISPDRSPEEQARQHLLVFISPDRSPEEQARQHLLVLEMKKKAKDN